MSANGEPELAYELMDNMVGNSQRPAEGNLRFNEVIGNLLDSKGLVVRQVPDPEYSDRSLLLADIGDPNADQVLGLISHCDVVGVDEAEWNTSPWELHEQGGYWVGRGVADTHGSAVGMLLAGMRSDIQERLAKTGRKLTLAFTYNEEDGDQMSFRGVKNAAGRLPSTPASLTAPYFIAGEPTEDAQGVMQATRASKGRWSANLHFSVNNPGHTGAESEDAHGPAFRMVGKLCEFNDVLRTFPVKPEIQEIFAAEKPYPEMYPTEVEMKSDRPSTTGRTARTYIDLRTLPFLHEEPVMALEALIYAERAKIPKGVEFRLEKQDVFRPSFTHAGSLIVRAAEIATGRRALGFGAGEEGSVMRAVKKEGITLGPGNLAEQAHTSNESIPIRSISNAINIYESIFRTVIGDAELLT